MSRAPALPLVWSGAVNESRPASAVSARKHRDAAALTLISTMLVVGCKIDDRVLSRSQPISFDSGPLGVGSAGGSSSVGTGGSPDGGGSTSSQGDAGGTGGTLDAGTTPGYDGGGCFHLGSDGKPDCDATLMANADFNVDTHAWPQADAFGSSTWRAVDSQGAAASGSLSVTNTYTYDASGMGPSAAAQCVGITGGKTYNFAAQIFIEGGQVYGSGEIAVWFYPTPDCSGGPDQAYVAASSDVTGAWTPASGSLISPVSDLSMSIRLGAEKPFRTPKLEVLFDAIRVTAQ